MFVSVAACILMRCSCSCSCCCCCCRVFSRYFRGEGPSAAHAAQAGRGAQTLVQLAGALHRDCETAKRLAAVVVGKCLHGAVAAAEECWPDTSVSSGPADDAPPPPGPAPAPAPSLSLQTRDYNAVFSGSLLSSLFAVASHACVTGRDSETKGDAAETNPKTGADDTADDRDGANLLPLSELLMNVFLAVLKAYVAGHVAFFVATRVRLA